MVKVIVKLTVSLIVKFMVKFMAKCDGQSDSQIDCQTLKVKLNTKSIRQLFSFWRANDGRNAELLHDSADRGIRLLFHGGISPAPVQATHEHGS